MGAESKTKAAAPKLVTVNNALKLAESWVNNMSGSKMTDPREVECEGRPPRLGLGAKAAPNMKRAASTDPLERNLLGKVSASKRKSLEDSVKGDPAEGNDSSGEDGDEPESRTNAFAKKKATPLVTSPQPKKRK